MSRPAKPRPDGEAPVHRLQHPITEHVEWLKALKAMRKNGLKTLSSLVGLLLSREYERLGITDALVLEEEKVAGGAVGRKKRKRT